MQKNENIISIYYWIAQLFLFAVMIVTFTGRQVPSVMALFAILMIVSADVMMTYMILKLTGELEIEEQIQIRKVHLKKRMHYFQMLQLRSRYIRRLYHDLSNHLMTIRMLQEEGQEKEKEQYIEQIKNTYQINTKICESESINLAAALYRLKCANDHKIVNIKMNAVKPVTEEYEIEVCSLFEQLADSAYEDDVAINDTQVVLKKNISVRSEMLGIHAES